MSSDSAGTDPAYSFVREQLLEISSYEINCLWNDKTSIKNRIQLFNPEGEITGYIFRFEMQNEDAGFMQIGIDGEDYYIVNFGFEGEDILTRLIKQYYSIVTYQNNMDKDQVEVLLGKLSYDHRIYYTGGFQYYVFKEDNQLVSLFDGRVLGISLGALSEEGSLYQKNRIEREKEESGFRSVSNYTVTGYSNASSYMNVMSYYSGYSNHCSPTAATNLTMYWMHGRGYFSNYSSSFSASYVFSRYYQSMQTNPTSGTNILKIRPAIQNFFDLYSGAPVSAAVQNYIITYNNIKIRINADEPIQLGILHYTDPSSTLGHDVNVWGYLHIDNSKYLRILDNYGTTTPFLINYTSYNYNHLTYCEMTP